MTTGQDSMTRRPAKPCGWGDSLLTGESYGELEELIETSENRFHRFPTKFDIHEYSIMEDFVDDLPAGAIRNELMNAIRGRGLSEDSKTTSIIAVSSSSGMIIRRKPISGL